MSESINQRSFRRELDAFQAAFLSKGFPLGMRPVVTAPPRLVERVWMPGPVRAARPAKVAWVRPELSDLFPGAEQRRPPRSPRSTPYGKRKQVPSRKIGRPVRTFSSYEAGHVLDMEFDRTVEAFVEQPMSLRLRDGMLHRPDAFVFMADGSPHEVREVKAEADAAGQEERWRAIGPAIAALGFTYRVVTEARTRHPVRSANVEILMENRRKPLPDGEDLFRLRITFEGRVGFSVAELEARCPFLDRVTVCALIRVQFLHLEDLGQPFDDRSMLRLGRSDISARWESSR